MIDLSSKWTKWIYLKFNVFKYLCFNRATIVLDAEHDRIEAIEYNVGFINWKIKGKNEEKNEWLIILFQSWVSFLLIAFCKLFVS